jgi:hypothetical protein
MTVRTSVLGGTDWDNEQLTDADLNDTIEVAAGIHYNEETDSGASDYTSTSSSMDLQRTFTWSSLLTTDCVLGVVFNGIKIKTSDAAGEARIGFEITDGTTTWAYQGPHTSDDQEPGFVVASIAGNDIIFASSSTSYNTAKIMPILCPPELFTSSTSWAVKVYILNSSGSHTTTLEKGFKVALIVVRRLTSVGSCAQT